MFKTSAGFLWAVLCAGSLSAQTLIASSSDATSPAAGSPSAAGQPAAATSASTPAAAADSQTASSRSTNFFVYERARVDAWKWFAAPPDRDEYRYLQSLFRAGVTQRVNRWDWELEMEQAVFQFISAPADVAFGSLQRQCCIRLDQVAGFGNNLSSDAHLPGQNGALGFLATRAKAAVDESLIQSRSWHGMACQEAF